MPARQACSYACKVTTYKNSPSLVDNTAEVQAQGEGVGEAWIPDQNCLSAREEWGNFDCVLVAWMPGRSTTCCLCSHCSLAADTAKDLISFARSLKEEPSQARISSRVFVYFRRLCLADGTWLSCSWTTPKMNGTQTAAVNQSVMLIARTSFEGSPLAKHHKLISSKPISGCFIDIILLRLSYQYSCLLKDIAFKFNCTDASVLLEFNGRLKKLIFPLI